MTVESAVAIISAVVAIIGAMAAIFTLSNSARKDAFQRLESFVSKLEERVNELEDENDALRDWASRLVNQLYEAGISPAPFRPYKRKKDKDGAK